MWRRFVPPMWKRRQMRRTPALQYEDDIFGAAIHIVKREAGGKKLTAKRLVEVASNLAKLANKTAPYNLALLLARSPRAAVAQMEMDIHHGGYKNRKARIYELIDFNDSFVDTVLSLPEDQLTTFPEQLQFYMETLCQKVNVLMMTDKQFYAIVHGLSREIAVFHAAKDEGFEVRMASRSEDARGADMVVQNKQGMTMNIDCKTRSSFHFRLLDLKRDQLITDEELLAAEQSGFMVLRKGKHVDFVRTTLVRASTQDLSDIKDFRFVDTTKIGDLLKQAMAAQ